MSTPSSPDAPLNPEPLLDQTPARVLQTARSNPRLAIRLLHPDLIRDPVLLAILRAEVQLALGQRANAAINAIRGVSLAGRLTPPVPATTLIAATVLTDIACATDDSHTQSICADLRDLADHHVATARTLLADILHAITIYHREDCAHGRALLTDLHHCVTKVGSDQTAAALAAGLTVADQWCTTPARGPAPPTRPLGPVPGGLLRPDPAAVTASWIEQRIQTRRCAGNHPATDKAPR